MSGIFLIFSRSDVADITLDNFSVVFHCMCQAQNCRSSNCHELLNREIISFDIKICCPHLRIFDDNVMCPFLRKRHYISGLKRIRASTAIVPLPLSKTMSGFISTAVISGRSSISAENRRSTSLSASMSFGGLPRQP